jgi:RNA polymerase sigma-70 factor (ECF subfamily)
VIVEAFVRSSVQPVLVTAGSVPEAEIPTDARNVELAKKGDVRAFERLYRNNLGRVYGLCLRMVADRPLAEELAQDVFIRAWQKLATFRGDSAFSSWLHRLAVNVVLSEQRTRRRRESRIVAVEDPEVHEKPRPLGPVGVRVDLDKAIAALPKGARRVFVLHDIEGHSHPEIADMVGVAVGTSKAHLHRARRLLRKALER